MTEERLLNIKEAAHYLAITERQIKDLVKSGRLVAYQIGGMYLRFKLEQLQNFKDSKEQVFPAKRPSLPGDIRDFLYFNDFYILATLVIIALVVIILRNIS
jgi:excisionase family DNA binding protein